METLFMKVLDDGGDEMEKLKILCCDNEIFADDECGTTAFQSGIESLGINEKKNSKK